MWACRRLSCSFHLTLQTVLSYDSKSIPEIPILLLNKPFCLRNPSTQDFIRYTKSFRRRSLSAREVFQHTKTSGHTIFAMIDTHSHIYLPLFRTDLDAVLQRASETGITDILMPAIDVDSLPEMNALSHPDIQFHKMVGIHPCEIKEHNFDPEETLMAHGSAGDIVAIGESGLDYYRSIAYADAQKTSLRRHCKAAKALNKPVILHNRNSTKELLDIIEDEQDGRLEGVWHCFNGTYEEALRALDFNLYLGIGGVITFKNAGVDKVARHLPLDRLLLETDAPWLAPVPQRGKRNEPSFIRYTAGKLAGLHEIALSEVDRITTQNARRLFRLV